MPNPFLIAPFVSVPSFKAPFLPQYFVDFSGVCSSVVYNDIVYSPDFTYMQQMYKERPAPWMMQFLGALYEALVDLEWSFRDYMRKRAHLGHLQ